MGIGIRIIAQIPKFHSYWEQDISLNNTQLKIGCKRKYPAIMNKKARPKSAQEWAFYVENEPTLKWGKINLKLKSKVHVYGKAIRVKEVISKAFYRPGNERWLIIEKFKDGSIKYFVSNAPGNTPLKKMIEWIHERWQIEQGYQQLKEELGLDHFEGRSWQGLHHHLTLCFMAYAFLYLLRLKEGKKITSINFTSNKC